ncbi:MAG TPA: MBL fold metallo-hydrolase [Bryobacteraceae bacterium]|nr:MBL fold metallo-hydrolase [Bryobacteraceae bacterium]
MNFKWLVIVTAAAGLALIQNASAAGDSKSVIDSAQKAMGNLKTVEYSGSGADFVLGQAFSPSSPWPRFIDKTYTRSINFEQPASHMHRARTQGENPPHGGGLQPVIGERPEDQVIVVSGNTPWAQQLEIVMLPQGFLNAAAKANATVKSQSMGGKKYQVVTFMGDNKAPVMGYIDDRNLVEKVQTKIDSNMYGDLPWEAEYSDYKSVNGVQFPMHIVHRQGGFPVLDLNVSDVKVNGPVSIQAASTPPPPAPTVGSKKLADGVYLITGGYASLAVDFKDYIVVIEGPQSEARGIAVIDESKRAIPNKPIKYVINTHDHIDHSSGLRPFVAEGATIVTHAINKPYFEKIWKDPHSLNPDRMAMSKKKPVFETMTEKKVMTDGTRTIELYHVTGSIHNEGMIMAWLPKEGILVEADEFNPPPQPPTATPNPIHPYHPHFAELLDSLKIDPQTIVPIHLPPDGRTVRKAELLLMAGKRAQVAQVK